MISVIIINYNTWHLTEKLVKSIFHKNEINDIEIVVVDNKSKNIAPNYFKNTERLKLINSKTNSGFAGGVNQGVENASNNIVFVLNSDVHLPKNEPFFQPIIDRLQHPKIAVVSPKIIFSEDRVIQFAGYTDINKYTGRGFGRGFNEVDTGQYDTAEQMPRAHGAAIAFKRDVWKKVGGFPENYFLYYEEMAFCELVKKAGLQVWYEPASTAFHIGSVSIEENDTPKTFYLTRNRIWFLAEHSSFFQKCFSFPYLFILGIARSFMYQLRGKPTKSKFILKGTLQGIFTRWK